MCIWRWITSNTGSLTDKWWRISGKVVVSDTHTHTLAHNSTSIEANWSSALPSVMIPYNNASKNTLWYFDCTLNAWIVYYIFYANGYWDRCETNARSFMIVNKKISPGNKMPREKWTKVSQREREITVITSYFAQSTIPVQVEWSNVTCWNIIIALKIEKMEKKHELKWWKMNGWTLNNYDGNIAKTHDGRENSQK